MSKCVGRQCGPKIATEGTAARYMEAECKRACAEGSDLCKICQSHEEANMGGKPGKWHGRIGGPIPAASHIVGSEWNIRKRVEEAATAAKKAAAAAKTVAASSAATKAEVSAVATLASVAEKEEEEAAKATRVAAIAKRKESAEKHKIEAAEHKLRRITLKAGKEAAAAARKRITASRKATEAATKATNVAEKATRTAIVVRRRTTTKKRSVTPNTTRSFFRANRSSNSLKYSPISNLTSSNRPERTAASASPPRPTYSERWAPATPIGSSDKSEKPNVQERIAANLTKLPELE